MPGQPACGYTEQRAKQRAQPAHPPGLPIAGDQGRSEAARRIGADAGNGCLRNKALADAHSPCSGSRNRQAGSTLLSYDIPRIGDKLRAVMELRT